MTTRFFLLPDGSLDPVEEPGRCRRYWELWVRREKANSALRDQMMGSRRERLSEECSDADLAINAHLEACGICRAWLARCEEFVNKPLLQAA